MSENIIEILNTDVVVEIDTSSYDLAVENLIVLDYNHSLNKPSINSVLLVGNKTSEDLGLVAVTEMSAKEDVDNKTVTIGENSTDVQYPSAKCVYDKLFVKTDTDLSNLSQAGQAIIDGKANASLSNLSSAGKKVLDGQWVLSNAVLLEDATATVSDPSPRSLASYLPNDGYNYEVILTGTGITGTTAGNQQQMRVQTDLITQNIYVWYVVTRTASAAVAAGSTILVVGTGRIIQVKGFTHNTGTYSLYLRGYRRIGTNS